MNATRKAAQGPKARFAEIDGRLKSGKYNSKTRKINRNYLDDYLKARKETGSDAVEARKAEAVALIANINAYKSPTGVAPPAPLPPKKAARKTKKSKTPPSPVRPRTPPPKPSDLYEQMNVSGDGNCFYRSLYRAAAEHENPAVLGRVFDILGADKSKMKSEETGQAALRAAVAAYYRTKFGVRAGPYEALLANYGTTQFRGWVREATSAQRAVYSKILAYDAKKDGKAEFYKDLAAVVGTNKQYASEIDYMMIKDILEAGGVRVISTQTSPDKAFIDGVPILYIKRLSYDHYNYWRKKRVAAAAAAAPKAKASPSSSSSNSSSNSNSSGNSNVSTSVAVPKPLVVRKPVTPPSSNSSNTNSNSNEDARQELLEKLEAGMDKHVRCVEKCRALAKEVEGVKAQLAKLGKR
jgi:hypothetical protein